LIFEAPQPVEVRLRQTAVVRFLNPEAHSVRNLPDVIQRPRGPPYARRCRPPWGPDRWQCSVSFPS